MFSNINAFFFDKLACWKMLKYIENFEQFSRKTYARNILSSFRIQICQTFSCHFFPKWASKKAPELNIWDKVFRKIKINLYEFASILLGSPVLFFKMPGIQSICVYAHARNDKDYMNEPGSVHFISVFSLRNTVFFVIVNQLGKFAVGNFFARQFALKEINHVRKRWKQRNHLWR